MFFDQIINKLFKYINQIIYQFGPGPNISLLPHLKESRVLTHGRLTHGWLVQEPFLKKVQISEIVSHTAWARAGPIRAHMGPCGPMWAHMGPYGSSWTGLGEGVNFPSTFRRDIWTNLLRLGSKTHFLMKFLDDSASFLLEKLKTHINQKP